MERRVTINPFVSTALAIICIAPLTICCAIFLGAIGIAYILDGGNDGD